jgi:hypothetical protein
MLYEDENLPTTKTEFITAVSQNRLTGRKVLPVPYTRSEVLADPGIQNLIGQGYKVVEYENKISPNDPYHLLVVVTLSRDAHIE